MLSSGLEVRQEYAEADVILDGRLRAWLDFFSIHKYFVEQSISTCLKQAPFALPDTCAPNLSSDAVDLMSANGAAARSNVERFGNPISESQLTQTREVSGTSTIEAQSGVKTSRRNNKDYKSWAHLVAGGVGGMTASTFTAPLDVLKTRLQSDFYQSQLVASRQARGLPTSLSSLSMPRAALVHFRETFQILYAIPKIEGARALFKGLGPTLVGTVPARSINFFAYGNGKRIISRYLNDGQEAAWVHLLAAAQAGIITGTATNPIWVVKTRLQLDKSQARKAITAEALERRYKGALDCTMQIIRTEGVKGLYRGLTASYLGVTESALRWVLYEQSKMFVARREEGLFRTQATRTWWDDTLLWAGNLFGAGGATLVAASITYPHEVVRTRMRQAPIKTDPLTGRPTLKYTNLIQCFRLVWKEEGLAAMYGGLTPHMLRVVPSAVIMFGVYESVLGFLGGSSSV